MEIVTSKLEIVPIVSDYDIILISILSSRMLKAYDLEFRFNVRNNRNKESDDTSDIVKLI